MRRKPRGATNVALTTWCQLCDATKRWWKRCGPAMWRKLGGASYAVQAAWSALCDASFVLQCHCCKR
eukprot:6598208-Pyramimonas_sp.AAC.1